MSTIHVHLNNISSVTVPADVFCYTTFNAFNSSMQTLYFFTVITQMYIIKF